MGRSFSGVLEVMDHHVSGMPSYAKGPLQEHSGESTMSKSFLLSFLRSDEKQIEVSYSTSNGGEPVVIDGFVMSSIGKKYEISV